MAEDGLFERRECYQFHFYHLCPFCIMTKVGDATADLSVEQNACVWYCRVSFRGVLHGTFVHVGK